MSNVLEYTLSLKDQLSANLQKIGITSTSALEKFVKLEAQSKKTSQLLKDMGGSVGSLREKLNLLKSEKEWIPASNLQSIRKYNSEIKNLEKEINHLDTVNGSVFKKNLSGAISNLPFADLITNPVAQVTAGLFQAGKMSMSFDEGIAKINTTAGLSATGVASLKGQLLTMGRESGADLSTVPDAYEKIISQTNDAVLSQEILKVSLKGAKAGFTDVQTVSSAVAQTLSLVGKENTTAQEVIDTLFAAKRVGAGEFKDFANYIPGLVASGQALGKGFKETAGVFAFMTGKGFAAEKSATLIENAYTALSKPKVSKNLEKTGVNVFDEKKQMNSMDKIMMSFDKKMKSFGKNDQAKLNYLAKVGLDDAQAKQAFFALSSGAEDLKSKIEATTHSESELEKAFKLAQNPMMLFSKMMSDMQAIAISVGDILGIVLAPILFGLSLTLGLVTDSVVWFSTKLQEGNPWIVGAALIIGLLTIAHLANTAVLKKNMITQMASFVAKKLSAFWDGVCAASTTLWATATALLTSALFLIPMAILAIIAIIAYLIYAFDGWGAAWKHTVNSAKLIWAAFVENMDVKFLKTVDSIKNGIGSIKKGWYEFQNLIGMGDKGQNNAAIAKINQDAEVRKKAITAGETKVKQNIMAGAVEADKAINSIHSNGKGFGTMFGDIKAKIGISDPKVPGAITKDDAVADNPEKPNGKTNEAIATGGTKHNYYTINIKEVIGLKDVIISAKDAAVTAGDQIGDGILRVLAMASTATG